MERFTESQLAAMTGEEKRNKFLAMADSYMAEHNCRWSEACLAVKKRYPQSRAAFGAPSLEYSNRG